MSKGKGCFIGGIVVGIAALGALIFGIIVQPFLLNLRADALLKRAIVTSAQSIVDASEDDAPFDQTYYFYNYTNPEEILMNMKPIIQEVRVQFKKHSRKFNVSIDEKEDTYTYQSYDWFEPLVEEEWNLTITTLNSLYVGGVGAASNELFLSTQFTAGVLGEVLAGMKLGGLGFSFSVFPVYMQTIMKAMLPYYGPVPGSNTQSCLAYTNSLNPNGQADHSLFWGVDGISPGWAGMWAQWAGYGGMSVSDQFETFYQIVNTTYTDNLTWDAGFVGQTDSLQYNPSCGKCLNESDAAVDCGYYHPYTKATRLAEMDAIKPLLQYFDLGVGANGQLGGNNPTFFSKLLAHLLNPASDVSILNPSIIINPLVGATGATWANIIAGTASPASLAAFATSFLVSVSDPAYTPELAGSDIGLIAKFIGTKVFPGGMAACGANPFLEQCHYFGTVKASLSALSVVDPSFQLELANLANWDDYGYMQFGAGLITRLGSALTQQDQGLTLSGNVELYAWHNNEYLTSPPGDIFKFKLTLGQSKEFFKQFLTDNKIVAFLGALQAAQSGDQSGVFAFFGIGPFTPAPAGIPPTDWGAHVGVTFYTYLTSKVPAIYLNTIAAAGSGFFIQKTVREMLHGWHDPAFGGPSGTCYPGYEGAETLVEPTEADLLERSNPNCDGLKSLPDKTTKYRGNTKSQIGTYQATVGVKEFWNMSDLGLLCPNPDLYFDDYEAKNCIVWKEKEVIDGLYDITKLTPNGDIDEPRKSFPAWVSSLKHYVTMIYDKTVTYKGIEMHQYKVDPKALLAPGSLNADDEEAIRYAERYRIQADGFANQATTFGHLMVPLFLGNARHLNNAIEKQKFQGLTTADWEDGTVEDLDTFVRFEPLSGFAMYGRQRLQLNMKVSKSQFNGHYGKQLWMGGGNSTSTYYPVFWAEEGSQIVDSDAASFADVVYGAEALGTTLMVVFIIVALLCLAGSGVLFYIGYNANKEDNANKGVELQ